MDVFDIVILGFDRSRPDSPAAGLQRVFPIDQGTAVRLINALPATVKRGVPRTAAEQYQAALTAIGARVELRKAAPKPEPKPAAPATSNAPPATAPAVLAPSRFTGAATLKQGSPIDSVPPPAPLSEPAAATSAAHLPTERPPASVSPFEPARAEAPVLATVVPDPTPESSGGEQWGGLLAGPKGKPASAPAPALDEREANRQELFRRLLDPRQTGPAELSPAENAGGISALELDLPPPRAGWASANQETLGADEVVAPAPPTTPAPDTSGRLTLAKDVATSGRPPKTPSTPPPRVQVFEPPADARSFHEALPDAIALSLREGGAQWVLLSGAVGLITAVLLIVLRSVSTLASVVAFCAALVLAALASEQAIWTLRAVVDDLDSPDGPDLRATDLGRYFSAGFNLLAVGFVTQLPFLTWLARHREQMPGALSSDPLGLLMLVVCAFYWPMAVGLQAIGENPLAVWSLPRGVRVIGACFVEYATLFLAAVIMALLPMGVVLLMTRMGLPAELSWLGIGLGFSLSQGTTAALIGHIARLHPTAFEDP